MESQWKPWGALLVKADNIENIYPIKKYPINCSMGHLKVVQLNSWEMGCRLQEHGKEQICCNMKQAAVQERWSMRCVHEVG